MAAGIPRALQTRFINWSKAYIVSHVPDIETRRRISESIHRDGPIEDLIVGKLYPVLASARWNDGGLRVYLHTVEEIGYPYPYPLEMFEITDSNIPSDWAIRLEQQNGDFVIKQISFPEWIADDCFYEKLVDEDRIAIAAYQHQRAAVLRENSVIRKPSSRGGSGDEEAVEEK